MAAQNGHSVITAVFRGAGCPPIVLGTTTLDDQIKIYQDLCGYQRYRNEK